MWGLYKKVPVQEKIHAQTLLDKVDETQHRESEETAIFDTLKKRVLATHNYVAIG